MKKNHSIVAAVLALVAFGAVAEETAVPVAAPADQVAKADDAAKTAPVVQVITTKVIGDEYRISPADFPNGVFVIARIKPLFRDPVQYDKIGALLANKLQSYGFKIAGKQEDASATLAFGGLDFDEIEKGETDRLSRALSVADKVGGSLLGFKLNGAQYVMANGISVQLGKKTTSLGISFTGPSPGDKVKKATASITVGCSEDTYRVSAILLDMNFNEWAKAHVVTAGTTSSTGTASPPAASVAAATEPK